VQDAPPREGLVEVPLVDHPPGDARAHRPHHDHPATGGVPAPGRHVPVGARRVTAPSAASTVPRAARVPPRERIEVPTRRGARHRPHPGVAATATSEASAPLDVMTATSATSAPSAPSVVPVPRLRVVVAHVRLGVVNVLLHATRRAAPTAATRQVVPTAATRVLAPLRATAPVALAAVTARVVRTTVMRDPGADPVVLLRARRAAKVATIPNVPSARVGPCRRARAAIPAPGPVARRAN
jgi:hypothetical protein